VAQSCRLGRTAEIIRDYVKKGNKLFIEVACAPAVGRQAVRPEALQDRGHRQRPLASLGRDDASGGGGYSRAASSSSASSFDQRPPAGPDDYAQQAEISDDDIPF